LTNLLYNYQKYDVNNIEVFQYSNFNISRNKALITVTVNHKNSDFSVADSCIT